MTERSWNAVSRRLEPPAVQGLLLESLGWNMLKYVEMVSIFALHGRSWECGKCRSTAFGVMQNLRLLLYSYSSWQAKCVADERSWNSPDSEDKNPNVNYSVLGYRYHRYDGYDGHQLFKSYFSEALGSALHATAARHGIGNLDGLGRSWRLETPWNSF